MKLQKLTSAVLLSALVLGSGATAFAAADTTTGKGTIKYVESTEPVGPTDPEKPGEIVKPKDEEEIVENKDKGTLQVNLVSNLKFGEVDLTTGAGKYFALPTNLVDADGQPIERGNYVQVSDIRGDGAFKGWELKAAVTKPFTQATSGNILKGAEITFMNPHVDSTQPEDLQPVAKSTFTLKTDGTPNTETALNASSGTGWGTHTVEFGRPANIGKNPIAVPTMGESVQLDVPANTPLSLTEAYVAEITWTIASL
ncbi:WxL domain-containing protein [uncultured Vagococcus sp.]|uniref:WxL domain-containing protein n=1 Tax=uncultured Vagococcus sp. TaxID=189676 RepID=UPI0028D5F9B7|nr:WxL domain-containing protein [uncultured Vagococcus sp.]